MRLRKAITACAVAATICVAGQATASASTFEPGTSVVDYLKSEGKDSSFAYRSQLALSYSVPDYIGSAEQNERLLGILRGTPVQSVQVPQEAPAPAESVQPTPAPAPQPKPQVVQEESNGVQGNTITVKATAYTADPSENGGTHNGHVLTATGYDLTAHPSAKVVAVDSNVIPLGSKVYVEGYGEAMALDTGGAIKGNRVDLLMPSNSAAEAWGVRTVKITILK